MATVDHTPLQVVCRGYQGDPFDWGIVLTLEDGTPADLADWTWQAWIDLGQGLVVPWICTPEAHGVALYLRGQDTIRVPNRYCPFDVTGRDPEAGEGRTVAAGYLTCAPRITPPLRAHQEVSVAPHELVTA
jgi:hypothetical protein